MSDTITILTGIDQNVFTSKRIMINDETGKIVKSNCSIGKEFKWEETEVSDIYTLSNVLLHLENQTDKLVIRGKPTVELGDMETGYRRQENFIDVPRQWICLDIDNWFIHDSINSREEPEAALSWGLTMLPTSLRNVTCHYQFSSSFLMGSNDHLKVHLWFWLDRPVSNLELKIYFKQYNEENPEYPVDIALFNSVQVHFTARPHIDPRITIPFSRRSGLCKKNLNQVPFPIIEIPERERKNKTHSTREQHLSPVTHQDMNSSQSIEEILAQIGDNRSGFHLPITLYISRLAATEGESADWDEHKESIRNAIQNADQSKHDKSSINKYLSDEYLDEDWNRCLVKFAKNPNRKDRLIPGIKTTAPLVEVTLEEAQNLIITTLEGWFTEEINTPMLINATPGAGKSRIVLDYLKEQIDAGKIKNFWYLTPTVVLAESLSQTFQGSSVVIRGRTQTHPDSGNHMCLKSDLVKAVQKNLGSIYQHLCLNKINGNRCEHFSTCPYLLQFQSAHEVHGIFMSHQYAVLSQRSENNLPQPDVVIIDENILQILVKRRKIAVKRFLRDAGKYRNLAQLITDEFKNSNSPIPKLLAERYTWNKVYQILCKLRTHQFYKMRKSLVTQNNPNSRFTCQSNVAILILEVLLKEWESQTISTELLSMYLKVGERIYSKKRNGVVVDDFIYLQYRLDLKIPSSSKILLLDGYAEPVLLKPMFNDLDFVSISVKQNAHIIQTCGFSASKISLIKGNNKDEVQRHQNEINGLIQRLSGVHDTGVIISYKNLEPQIIIPDGWYKNHFNNIRGINTYQDCDLCIVLGRTQPPVEILERFIRGLFYDQNEEFIFIANSETNYPLEPDGFYTADHTDIGIMVPQHPDPICNAYLRMTRENEVLQAIGRIRAIRSTEPKWIIIINELPLPITVDAILPYRNLVDVPPLVQSIIDLGGILPISSTWLYRKFPERWTSTDAVRKQIDRLLKFPEGQVQKPDTILLIYIIRVMSAFRVTDDCSSDIYRFNSSANRRHLGCWSVLDESSTKIRLEEMFGPINDFAAVSSDTNMDSSISDPSIGDAA